MQKLDLSKKKAVLFDYDGVLVETPQQNFRCWEKVFKQEFGVVLDKHDYFLLEGLSAYKIACSLALKYKLPKSDFRVIVEKKEDFFRKSFKTSTYPSVWKTLRFLKDRNILLGLITGASKKRLYENTPRKLLSMFDVVICAEDSSSHKPNPGPFLQAIKSIKVSKKDALVVENSYYGIKSAKSSGLYCVALCTTLEKKYLVSADVIFRDFSIFSKFVKENL